jgi:hypothetical protein
VNDIALAIHKLLEKFSRVLYIDLDVHHGEDIIALVCLNIAIFAIVSMVVSTSLIQVCSTTNFQEGC